MKFCAVEEFFIAWNIQISQKTLDISSLDLDYGDTFTNNIYWYIVYCTVSSGMAT